MICIFVLGFCPSMQAAAKDTELHEDVKEAITILKKSDSSLKKWFNDSHGYAVFPRVVKGAIGIGGAYGEGQVFEKGKLIGDASLSQVTLGVQLGGQTYIEVIYFEDEKALESFKASDFKLSAQASAVAAAEGAAADAKYELGVAIFTLARGGLMFEASVGGQKFEFKPIQGQK
jgi:lipid-binding SYLF domain-containing protein